MTATLFDPIQLGDYYLKNRVFMAPMTRARTGPAGIPDELVAIYYAQRASAGLVISEATAVHPRGDGWPGAPGIYTDEQQAGWAAVADAVHAEGGRIFMQIWHMGRAALSESIEGQKPLAPSPVAATGEIPNSKGVPTAFDTPEAMSAAQIREAVSAFATAARRAIDAGLDGVEIHAANNFLIDAFLRDGSNRRSDEYGGSVENRSRFLLEVVDAVTAEIGAGKVGVRFSPTNAVFGISDANPEAIFTYAARQLSRRNLAYLHVLEPALDSGSPMSAGLPLLAPALRESYDGLMILNGSLTQQTGQRALTSDAADAIAFGVPFISNPDLVERFRNNIALSKPNPDTFYGGGAEGYTDYPAKELESA
ncbi:alkene reductase [Candidatus Halocynthiibacter alkanivorans]|uniref:alkene reductase n=1 Tax=Candidatus Halocynthiibacter alkanivorans TaxID=2267619 RepID=UPI000DF1C9C4|nr:alkene reductase [Candidatus Halocynthiibacter alkanivorans]